MFRTTTVIELGSKAFAIQSQCDHGIQLTESPHLDLRACFVLGNSTNLADTLQKAHISWLQNDDVFCDAFLKNVLLVTNETSFSASVLQLLASWGCRTLFHVASTEKVLPGPYFFSSLGLYCAWRLFPDDKGAFILSTIPSQEDPYTVWGVISLCGLPSRLKACKSERAPLAGMRVAVKDLFHLKGVHTGCGNRAYRSLSAISVTSSDAVRSVIDLGGVIVGKTKTVEFGGSQEVTGDWSDYFYPLNARGDGYIAATGSSIGSASSLTAYPWLDISLGTDAGGSIRDPAVAHGIYGFRPSHDGKLTPNVVIPCGAEQSDNPLRPSRIIFPEEYWSDHGGVQSLAEDWVASLADWLGADKIDMSIEDQWNATKPEGISRGFFDTFNKTFIDLIYSGFWTYLADFREEYREKFASDSYVCKVTQYLWDKGRSLSETRRQEALAEVSLHNSWFLEHMLNDEETIMIVPRYKLDFRDEYLCAPELRGFDGFDSNLHASLSGVPNLIVPVGQCEYQSDITGTPQQFPVSLSIIGPKGLDVGLLGLVHDYLTAKGLPASVLTGRTAFHPSMKLNKELLA
ncbi:amidase-like protein [Lasiosphaeria hispida]|uniref:Amidase-like protein n=1 Tax=Lasiosphaeria hispida TaxID=260671 RepID=A0AAJ0HAE7_9PEZI|nr:amidase-like protein [Lasiosphaeria hispida]